MALLRNSWIFNKFSTDCTNLIGWILATQIMVATLLVILPLQCFIPAKHPGLGPWEETLMLKSMKVAGG